MSAPTAPVLPAQVVLAGQAYALDTWSPWIAVGTDAGRAYAYRWQLWTGPFGATPHAVGYRYEIREADAHPGGGTGVLRVGDPDPAALCRTLALEHWPGQPVAAAPVQLGLGL